MYSKRNINKWRQSAQLGKISANYIPDKGFKGLISRIYKKFNSTIKRKKLF
jgi:hypothetical protein